MAVIEPGLALMVDCAALTVPGARVTLHALPPVMAVPLMVPVMLTGLPAVEVGDV